MTKIKHPSILHFLLLILIIAPILIQGSRSPRGMNSIHHLSQIEESKRSSKRVMIGSVAPTCTYNECRGCKYRCRAEQVPVEGNDPIHSAYHYKCVCHR